MLDPKAINSVADFLKPDDFYQGKNEAIYQSMLILYSQAEPIDILSLSNRLKKAKKLKEIGSEGYLTELVNSVPSAANIVHYAKIVTEKSALRRLIGAAAEITYRAFNEENDTVEILDEAEKKILSVSQQSSRQSFVMLKPMLEEAFNRLDELSKGNGALRGLPTGFIDIDNKLAGLQKSDLLILAARPSLGKSSLALDIARNVAVHHKQPVGIFSLEMSKDQLVDRLLCSQGNVELWKFRTGRLSGSGENSDFSRISQAIDCLSQAPIYIDDSSATNIMQIRTMARRLQAERGLGLLIVDYLQLMEGSKKTDNRVQEISEISRSLKTLARELNVPILAVSQLSRAVEQRTPAIPKLSDLRESGSIEQDADVVLFIYREDRERRNSDRKNIADIIIAKHRNGPIGQVPLYFNEDYVSFRNLEKHYAQFREPASGNPRINTGTFSSAGPGSETSGAPGLLDSQEFDEFSGEDSKG